MHTYHPVMMSQQKADIVLLPYIELIFPFHLGVIVKSKYSVSKVIGKWKSELIYMNKKISYTRNLFLFY